MRHGKRGRSAKEYLIGALLGILTSFLVGGIYFHWSSQSLRHKVNILARGLESRGVAKFAWDKSGNLKGVEHFLNISFNSKAGFDVKAEVVKSETSNRKH
jgi:hypothetical protein